MRLARAPVYLFLLIIVAESISMSIFAAPINNGDEICVGRVSSREWQEQPKQKGPIFLLFYPDVRFQTHGRRLKNMMVINLLPAPQARVLRGPQEVGDGNQFSGETAGNQLPRGTLIAIRNQFWGGDVY